MQSGIHNGMRMLQIDILFDEIIHLKADFVVFGSVVFVQIGVVELPAFFLDQSKKVLFVTFLIHLFSPFHSFGHFGVAWFSASVFFNWTPVCKDDFSRNAMRIMSK